MPRAVGMSSRLRKAYVAPGVITFPTVNLRARHSVATAARSSVAGANTGNEAVDVPEGLMMVARHEMPGKWPDMIRPVGTV